MPLYTVGVPNMKLWFLEAAVLGFVVGGSTNMGAPTFEDVLASGRNGTRSDVVFIDEGCVEVARVGGLTRRVVGTRPTEKNADNGKDGYVSSSKVESTGIDVVVCFTVARDREETAEDESESTHGEAAAKGKSVSLQPRPELKRVDLVDSTFLKIDGAVSGGILSSKTGVVTSAGAVTRFNGFSTAVVQTGGVTRRHTDVLPAGEGACVVWKAKVVNGSLTLAAPCPNASGVAGF